MPVFLLHTRIMLRFSRITQLTIQRVSISLPRSYAFSRQVVSILLNSNSNTKSCYYKTEINKLEGN